MYEKVRIFPHVWLLAFLHTCGFEYITYHTYQHLRKEYFVGFVSGFVESQAIKRGKSRIRGGQTLRDTLFAATEAKRLVKKAKCISKLISSCITKPNTVVKDNNEATCSNISSPAHPSTPPSKPSI